MTDVDSAAADRQSGQERPKGKRSIGWINAAILIGILAVSTWWFHLRPPHEAAATTIEASQPAAKPPGEAATPPPAMTVTLVQATTGDWPIRLAADGSIAAWQEASISPEVGGLRIAEVLVNVGDAVRKGQTLAVLAASAVDYDLAAQNAALAEARAALAEATANAERARRLTDSGAISAQQIQQYETGLRTATARVQAVQARLKSEQLRQSQTRVVANDDGVIAVRAATVGAVAQAGQELFRLIRHGRLEWRALVPAADLSRIAPQQTVQLQLPDGMKVAGTVRSVAPVVDPQTRNGLVYVDLAPLGGASGASPLVLPGMFARGEIDLGRSQVLTLPASAVLLREGFAFVFKYDPATKTVAATKVLTGRRQGDRIEIARGILPEESVVERGVGFLADGDVVTLSRDAGGATRP